MFLPAVITTEFSPQKHKGELGMRLKFLRGKYKDYCHLECDTV
jgi:hypothetical protein